MGPGLCCRKVRSTISQYLIALRLCVRQLREPVSILDNSTRCWRLSLRFTDAEVERAFVNMRRNQLANRMAIAFCLTLIYASVGVATALFTMWETSGVVYFNNPEVRQAVLLRNFAFIAFLAVTVIGVVISRFRCLSARGLETSAALTLCLLVLLIIVVHNPKFILLITGQRIDGNLRTTQTDSNTKAMWMVTVVIQAAHVLLPVRVCWYHVVEVWIFSVFVMVSITLVAFDNAEGNSLDIVKNILLLFCANFASGHGKRAIEWHERYVFLQMALERTLRAIAEHKLEELSGETHNGTRKKALVGEDDRSCAHSTTLTGQLFNTFNTLREAAVDDSSLVGQLLDLGLQEHWLIPQKEVEPLPDRVIGRGGFGVVLLAKYHGSEVVLKAARHEGGAVSVKYLLSILDELRTLRRARHPNIVSLLGACIKPTNFEILLVLEYIRGSSLDVVCVQPPRGPSLGSRCRLLYDVSCALHYLHSLSPIVVHGDIKGGNVLVHAVLQDGKPILQAKLADFGLSRVLNGSHIMDLGGTLAWMPPEVLLAHQPPSPSADLFSFGRLIFMALVGENPLIGWSKFGIQSTLARLEVPQVVWPSHVSAFIPDAAKELEARCCEADPPKRPNVRVVQEHILEWDLPQSGNLKVRDVLFQKCIDAPTPLTTVEAEKVPVTRSHLAAAQAQKLPATGAPCVGPEKDADDAASLMHPNLRSTPKESKLLTLLTAMIAWNMELPRLRCCRLHAMAADMALLLEEINSHDCISITAPPCRQCPKCLLLDVQPSEGASNQDRRCVYCSGVHCQSTASLISNSGSGTATARSSPDRSALLQTVLEMRSEEDVQPTVAREVVPL